MSLSLKESKAIAEIADIFYSFLPGSGDPKWKGHVSFKTVAEKVGVGEFWQPGSKQPMITALLQRTLEHRRGCFERLILEIVRCGLTYREKQGNSVQPSEIQKLNGLLLDVGFKFPDLWDPDFIALLDIDSGKRAQERVDAVIAEENLRITEKQTRSVDLRSLRDEYFDLGNAPSPQAAGLIFRGKIEGKSAYTRGLFISLNGITNDARIAITTGKQPTFFVIDGYDLTMVLSDEVKMIEFLRQRRRLLAEEGAVVVPFPQLWRGSRGSH